MLTRPDAKTTARRCPLLALLALSTTSCAAMLPLPPASTPPTAEAFRTEQRHEVRFATNSAEMSAEEAARLDSFLGQTPNTSPRSVRLKGYADERAGGLYNLELSARRAAGVEQRIKRLLGVETEVNSSALGELSPVVAGATEQSWSRNRAVEVVVTSWLVRLPECSAWDRNPVFDPRNLPISGHGCANAVNLGLMVANPADLESGRDLGAGDGTREAEAVVRYRTDKVKPLDDQTVAK